MLILRDLNTGQVSALDLATLQIVATTQTTAGLGVSVALHEDAAFVVDAVQGMVRQLDPRIADAGRRAGALPAGHHRRRLRRRGSAVDRACRRGHRLRGHRRRRLPAAAARPAATGGGLSPQRVRDPTPSPSPATTWSSPRWTTGWRCWTGPPARWPRCVAASRRTVAADAGRARRRCRAHRGDDVPVTVVGRPPRVRGRRRRGVSDFAVPGEGAELQPGGGLGGPVLLRRRRHRHGLRARPGGQAGRHHPGARAPTGRWSWRCGRTTCSSTRPNSATAQVVDDKHQVREVDKYANDVLGGDPPPDPPPPPPPPRKPR